MNAYASRYHCNRLALVYLASVDCPPGKVTEFMLMTEERPMLEVVAVDVRELAIGSGIPAGIAGMIPSDRHWKQTASPAAIYEAIIYRFLRRCRAVLCGLTSKSLAHEGCADIKFLPTG